jgi:hypothetical protein
MLIQYFVFSGLVGKARVQHKVDAPAITGHPEFERYFRVHQNTLEQLIVVLPALWMFGWYVDAMVGAAIGVVFIIGRWVYCTGYLADPAQRAKGFIVGVLAQTVLVLGALIWVILGLFGWL